MKCAIAVPLLAKLSKIELAKLIPDITERNVMAGGFVREEKDRGHVHFIVDGQLELVEAEGYPLVSWQTGEIVNEEDLLLDDEVRWKIRAIVDTNLVTIPVERFTQLIETNAKVASEYRRISSTRSAQLLGELQRTRGLLANYAEELWRDMPIDTMVPLAAGISVSPLAPSAAREPISRARSWQLPWPKIGAVVGTLAGVLIAINGDDHNASVTLGLLVAAAANWLAGVVPDFAVALAISILAILLNLATPALALSGFINPAWFLLVAVWGIGVAVNRSGLLYRLALGMLRLFPPSYIGQSLALGITGLLSTPLLPSGQARVVMVAPLVKELSEAMHFRRNSRGAAGLAMTCLIGFGLMYFMFLNGSTLPLLAYSLLPDAVKPQITWTFWIVAALPLGIFIFVASSVAIQRLLPPEPAPPLLREVIQMQLRVLGRMGRGEWITAAVVITTLGAFALAGIYGFEPAWIAMGGMLVLVAAGVLDRESLKRGVDWGFILFFGAVLSFAGVIRHNGVDVRISEWIIPWFTWFNGSSWAFVTGVTVATFMIRLVIPAVQSVPLLIIALTPVAVAVGINPFVVSLIVLTMGTNFVIPQQSPFYMALHAGTEESFSHSQIHRIGSVHALIILVGLVAIVPYWQWLGLLP